VLYAVDGPKFARFDLTTWRWTRLPDAPAAMFEMPAFATTVPIDGGVAAIGFEPDCSERTEDCPGRLTALVLRDGATRWRTVHLEARFHDLPPYGIWVESAGTVRDRTWFSTSEGDVWTIDARGAAQHVPGRQRDGLCVTGESVVGFSGHDLERWDAAGRRWRAIERSGATSLQRMQCGIRGPLLVDANGSRQWTGGRWTQLGPSVPSNDGFVQQTTAGDLVALSGTDLVRLHDGVLDRTPYCTGILCKGPGSELPYAMGVVGDTVIVALGVPANAPKTELRVAYRSQTTRR
jgi:hypothetical protein